MMENVLFIGLIEEDGRRAIMDVTKEILLMSGYKIQYESINGDVTGFCNGNSILIIFDFILKDLENLNLSKLYFDIIVHPFVKENDIYSIDILRTSKICILNSDNGRFSAVFSKLEKTIVVTYGFNSKATVTISSFNLDEFLEANLCLQRSVVPLTGDRIEPFEYYLQLSKGNEDSTYPILAATTLALLIGDSILNTRPEKNIIITT